VYFMFLLQFFMPFFLILSMLHIECNLCQYNETIKITSRFFISNYPWRWKEVSLNFCGVSWYKPNCVITRCGRCHSMA
jgi:hypothetical protein